MINLRFVVISLFFSAQAHAQLGIGLPPMSYMTLGFHLDYLQHCEHQYPEFKGEFDKFLAKLRVNAPNMLNDKQVIEIKDRTAKRVKDKTYAEISDLAYCKKFAEGNSVLLISNMYHDEKSEELNREIIESQKLKFLDHLEQGEPCIGLRLDNEEPNAKLARLATGKQRDLVVEAIEANSPASIAEIQVGDIILLGGTRKLSRASDLEAIVIAAIPGSSLPISVERNGQILALKVKIGKRQLGLHSDFSCREISIANAPVQQDVPGDAPKPARP